MARIPALNTKDEGHLAKAAPPRCAAAGQSGDPPSRRSMKQCAESSARLAGPRFVRGYTYYLA
ncbi:hypothetical protein ACRS8P_06355 [Burkholderia cenocepacia]